MNIKKGFLWLGYWSKLPFSCKAYWLKKGKQSPVCLHNRLIHCNYLLSYRVYLLITVKEKVHLKKNSLPKVVMYFWTFWKSSFWSQIFKFNVLDWFTVLIHFSRVNKHSVLSLFVFSLNWKNEQSDSVLGTNNLVNYQ